MNVTQSNRILILEDEPLIALDLDYMLENAGFKTTVCTTFAEAMEWLAARSPRAAILDIHLKDGPSTAVASLLRNRSVPFVVCSGAGKMDAPEIFSSGTWLSKPSDDASVLNAINEAMQALDFDEHLERGMTPSDKPQRRPRGASPRGDFEVAKAFASRSEEARIAADRMKTDALREARLKKMAESLSSPGRG